MNVVTPLLITHEILETEHAPEIPTLEEHNDVSKPELPVEVSCPEESEMDNEQPEAESELEESVNIKESSEKQIKCEETEDNKAHLLEGKWENKNKASKVESSEIEALEHVNDNKEVLIEDSKEDKRQALEVEYSDRKGEVANKEELFDEIKENKVEALEVEHPESIQREEDNKIENAEELENNKEELFDEIKENNVKALEVEQPESIERKEDNKIENAEELEENNKEELIEDIKENKVEELEVESSKRKEDNIIENVEEAVLDNVEVEQEKESTLNKEITNVIKSNEHIAIDSKNVIKVDTQGRVNLKYKGNDLGLSDKRLECLYHLLMLRYVLINS
jgi:hypothetical protein